MEEYNGLIKFAYEEQWSLVRDPRVRPNMYLVSTFGRVCHAYSREILRLELINSGYLTVHLIRSDSDDRKYVSCLVHRLVAEAFIPNDSPLKNTVNHIDGNKLNNYVWNLEWMTQLENNIHADLYKSGVEHYKAKLTEKQVRTACEMLSKNERYRDIITAIGLDPNEPNNYDIIGNIRRRITYLNISKDYVFPYKTRINKHSEKEIREICKCISDGLTMREAFTKLTGKVYSCYTDKSFNELYRNIKIRKICKEISNEYDF